jgi:hypothetical protein
MGIRIKVDGVEQPTGQSEHIEPKETLMSEEMTNRLWEVINENTELKQQLYFAEHRLEQIRRLLEA